MAIRNENNNDNKVNEKNLSIDVCSQKFSVRFFFSFKNKWIGSSDPL